MKLTFPKIILSILIKNFNILSYQHLIHLMNLMITVEDLTHIYIHIIWILIIEKLFKKKFNKTLILMIFNL